MTSSTLARMGANMKTDEELHEYASRRGTINGTTPLTPADARKCMGEFIDRVNDTLDSVDRIFLMAFVNPEHTSMAIRRPNGYASETCKEMLLSIRQDDAVAMITFKYPDAELYGFLDMEDPAVTRFIDTATAVFDFRERFNRSRTEAWCNTVIPKASK